MKNDNHFGCLEYNFKQLVPRSRKKYEGIKCQKGNLLHGTAAVYNCRTATRPTRCVIAWQTNKCL